MISSHLVTTGLWWTGTFAWVLEGVVDWVVVVVVVGGVWVGTGGALGRGDGEEESTLVGTLTALLAGFSLPGYNNNKNNKDRLKTVQN